MDTRQPPKNVGLSTTWEFVADADAEHRLLQAYELLLKADGSPAAVDRNQGTSQDVIQSDHS